MVSNISPAEFLPETKPDLGLGMGTRIDRRLRFIADPALCNGCEFGSSYIAPYEPSPGVCDRACPWQNYLSNHHGSL